MFYAVGQETGCVYVAGNSKAEVSRMLLQEFPSTKLKECNLKTSSETIKQILPETIKLVRSNA